LDGTVTNTTGIFTNLDGGSYEIEIINCQTKGPVN